MDKETNEALEAVLKIAKKLIDEKYAHRKRLNQSEIWERATLCRDIVAVENWVKKGQ